MIDPLRSQHRAIAGEWVHPAGVRILRQLGVDFDSSDCAQNRGFIIHSPGGETPIVLEHAGSVAWSMPHATLTMKLRQAALAHPSITLLRGHRVLAATEDGLVQTTYGCMRAALVVGADGRSSAVRASLRPGEAASVRLSRTAGITLRLATLPTEDYGHVFLGAPGPIMLFRLTPDRIRITFDIPTPGPAASELLRHLVEEYLPHLPRELRTAARGALTARLVQWASNAYRPRIFQGRRRCALVGDAVGHNHPLAAHGLSLALLDASHLAEAANLSEYRRRSRCATWSAEHVSAVLGRLFLSPDALSADLRTSLFAEWSRGTERAGEAMHQLALLDTRKLSVAHTFARVAARTASGGAGQRATTLPRRAFDIAAWGAWLGRSHPPYRSACG